VNKFKMPKSNVKTQKVSNCWGGRRTYVESLEEEEKDRGDGGLYSPLKNYSLTQHGTWYPWDAPSSRATLRVPL
jgi:hypothetical protein